MSSSTRWSLVAFALVGLALSGASSWVHYRVLTDPGYVSPCDLSAAFNCSQVYLSRYGSLWGVPVALGGLAWFGFVTLLAAGADTEERGNVAAGYLSAAAVVGMAVILFLAYASFVVLRTGCVLCLGTYVCVVSIAVLVHSTHAVPMTRLPFRLLGDLRSLVSRPLTLVLALLYLAGTASAVALFPSEEAAARQAAAAATPSPEAQANFSKAWAQQPRVDLGIPANGAKVIIVKFNDFMCPSCKQAETFYKPILDRFAKSHPGAVKYIVKDWPWNSACNFNASTTIRGHEAACNAAAAARMAKDRGKYEEMAAWLYANQGTTPTAVREAAGRILGVKDFDKEYALKLPEIRRDIADGGVLRINSTPTFFINGVRIPDGIIPAEYFELAITLELKRAG